MEHFRETGIQSPPHPTLPPPYPGCGSDLGLHVCLCQGWSGWAVLELCGSNGQEVEGQASHSPAKPHNSRGCCSQCREVCHLQHLLDCHSATYAKGHGAVDSISRLHLEGAVGKHRGIVVTVCHIRLFQVVSALCVWLAVPTPCFLSRPLLFLPSLSS